jgi:hypothetical protein
MYYTEVDFIPNIPAYLLDTIDIIETYQNVYPDTSYASTYASYAVPDKLSKWIQQYFEYPVITRYQVIKKQLPVHIDWGITGIKYNYLLETGGENVKTLWWDSVDDPKEIKFETISKLNIWHTLNIEEPHSISEINSPRISVTVRKK